MSISELLTSCPRKRHQFDGLEDDPKRLKEHSCERNNCGKFVTYVLDSESPVPTDEDTESVHSIQLADTASPKDTSDTSWSSDSVTMDVEFEEYDVASPTNSEKLLSNCDSSGTDDLLCTATAATVLMATNLCEERDLWADSSDVESDVTTDTGVPRAVYWECVRCKSKCIPLFRFCLKCFQLRKGYFPERPKRTRPRRKARGPQPGSAAAKSPRASPNTDRILSPTRKLPVDPSTGALTKGDSGISMGMVEDMCLPDSASSVDPLSQELLGSQISDLGGSQKGPSFSSKEEERESDPRSELCFMCVERPKNGGFVHKKTVHVLCCYQCSLQVWNSTRRCPLCNKHPQNVSRLIFG